MRSALQRFALTTLLTSLPVAALAPISALYAEDEEPFSQQDENHLTTPALLKHNLQQQFQKLHSRCMTNSELDFAVSCLVGEYLYAARDVTHEYAKAHDFAPPDDTGDLTNIVFTSSHNPERWNVLLPMSGRVLSAEEGRVEISIGTHDSVSVGCVFSVSGDAGRIGWIFIDEVETDRAFGNCSMDGAQRGMAASTEKNQDCLSPDFLSLFCDVENQRSVILYILKRCYKNEISDTDMDALLKAVNERLNCAPERAIQSLTDTFNDKSESLGIERQAWRVDLQKTPPDSTDNQNTDE